MKVKSYVEYEMENGDVVIMSSSMAALYKLRQKDKKAYESMMKFINSMQNMGDKVEIDVVEIGCFMHGAYLGANADNENAMSFDEFLENSNPDIGYNAEKMMEMLTPKKK